MTAITLSSGRAIALDRAGETTGGHWVTIDGQHILIGRDGTILAGNKAVTGGLKRLSKQGHKDAANDHFHQAAKASDRGDASKAQFHHVMMKHHLAESQKKAKPAAKVEKGLTKQEHQAKANEHFHAAAKAVDAGDAEKAQFHAEQMKEHLAAADQAKSAPKAKPQDPKESQPKPEAKATGPAVEKTASSFGPFDVAPGVLSDAKEVLATISKTHALETMHRISVEPMPAANQESLVGSYSPFDSSIQVNPTATASYSRVVVAHEFGHAIDHHFSGKGNYFAAERDPDAKELFDAINASAATKELHGMTFGGERYKTYLMEPREQFARAYAQYVAASGLDQKMKSEIARVTTRPPTGAYVPEQWDAEDFKPVHKAMASYLQKKGLIRG